MAPRPWRASRAALAGGGRRHSHSLSSSGKLGLTRSVFEPAGGGSRHSCLSGHARDGRPARAQRALERQAERHRREQRELELHSRVLDQLSMRQRAADRRAAGLGGRLRRHRRRRRGARHRHRLHPPRPGRARSSPRTNFTTDRRGDDVTGTAPTSPSTVAGSGAASGGRARASRPGATLMNGKVLDSDRQRPGVVGHRRHAVGRDERRRRRSR